MPADLWGTLHHLRSAPAASDANRLYHTVGEFPRGNSPILALGQTARGSTLSGVGKTVERRPLPPLPLLPTGLAMSLERREGQDANVGRVGRLPSTPAGEWLSGGTGNGKGKGKARAVSPPIDNLTKQ